MFLKALALGGVNPPPLPKLLFYQHARLKSALLKYLLLNFLAIVNSEFKNVPTTVVVLVKPTILFQSKYLLFLFLQSLFSNLGAQFLDVSQNTPTPIQDSSSEIEIVTSKTTKWGRNFRVEEGNLLLWA